MKKIIIGIIVYMLLITTVMPLSGYSLENKETSNQDNTQNMATDWLIMVYLDGDNDKWSRANKDLDEIFTPRIAPNIDITILHDSNNTDDFSGTKLYHMKNSDIHEFETIPWGGTELNMGDEDTLENFVEWSLDNYEADRNMLILWDHGGSWRGCCVDHHSGHDWLRPDEIRDALTGSLGGIQLDILYMAACYMADMEICFELTNFADYYIGSEYVCWMGGSTYGQYCDYNNMISGIQHDNSLDVDEICKRIIDIAIMPNCITYCESKSHTFSVLDLSWLGAFVNTLDDLARKMIENFNDPTLDPQYCNDIITSRENSPGWNDNRRMDLYDFADILGENSIKTGLDSVIVHERHHQGDDDAQVTHAHGLHIVFPGDVDDWLSNDYLNNNWIENFRLVCHWDEWLSLFYDTIFVDDDFSSSTPCWQDTFFHRINDGIDEADNDDTVWVFNGRYEEQVWIDKSIDLIGIQDQVVIDNGVYIPTAVTIDSDWVNLSGFTIENTLYGYTGIELWGDNCNISNNRIVGQRTNGIHTLNADNNVITRNIIEENECGIFLLHSDDNLIYDNYFNNNDNAWDDGYNTWNISKVLRPGRNIIDWPWTAGNYWSDYEGRDTGGFNADALGDTETPHNCNGDIQHGGDMEPLLYTIYVGGITFNDLDPKGMIYIFNHKLEIPFLQKSRSIVVGSLLLEINVEDRLKSCIDEVALAINGKELLRVPGPIIEPPIHKWKALAFGKCELIISATDHMDTTVEYLITLTKFF